ncbi:MAG: hypothetical protein AAF715_12220 [Myxococcota bacterium]
MSIPDPSATSGVSGWIATSATAWGDPSVLQIWIAPKYSRLYDKLDGASVGQYPHVGSVVIMSTGITDNYLLEHEVGHYFSLKHTFQVDQNMPGYHPETGADIDIADRWDQIFCVGAGAPFSFISKPSAATVSTYCNIPEVRIDRKHCYHFYDRISCEFTPGYIFMTGDEEMKGISLYEHLREAGDWVTAFPFTMNAMSYRTDFESFPVPGTPLPARISTHISESQGEIIRAFLDHGTSYPVTDPSPVALFAAMGFQDPRTQRGLLATNTWNWKSVPGSIRDIAAGSNGTVWSIRSSDGRPQRWDYEQESWVPGPAPVSGTRTTLDAVRIGIAGEDDVWAIDSSNNIYRLNSAGSGTWDTITGKAIDVSGGRTAGSVWVLGHTGIPHFWTGSSWTSSPGILADRIAVAEDNSPIVAEKGGGDIYRLGASSVWTAMGGSARDVGASANGQLFVIGYGSGYTFIWDPEQETWVFQSAHPADNVAVSDWGVPWVGGASGAWAQL